MLKYDGCYVTLLEIPDEISLAFTITGCNVGCPDCHSKELWDDNLGIPLTVLQLQDIIAQHKHITNVLFMGGEWDKETLLTLINLVKSLDLKASLYTGQTMYSMIKTHLTLLQNLSYIKVGSYIKAVGGLDSPSTNQKLFYRNIHKEPVSAFKDITYKFHNKRLHNER